MLDTNVLISALLYPGAKDFADIDVEKPEIMTPAEFMEEFL